MRFLRIVGVFVLLISVSAIASDNKLGIREVSHVKFDAPTRIGAVVLPAGEYTIRHSMEGQEHVMAFQGSNNNKDVFKVKCTLVQLPRKADQDQSIFELKAGSERVLHELVFRGDTAKHVF
jgi:hypothetical protein